MAINDLVFFLKDFFYKTFEVLPMIGWSANYFFLLVMTGLFLYWLSVLAKTPKTGK